MSAEPLREDALTIWQAGVDAVNSAELVRNCIDVTNDGLTIAGHEWKFGENGRICVVGGGKAGAGMSAGLESTIEEQWKSRVFGWVNVPEDCVTELEMIHLHGARAAGVNEPSEAGVEGVQEILECVSSLCEDDLCIVLISGGGSALLPAPIDGISLEDKQKLTRSLMHAGATIQELNAVRRALSKIKGGGLLRACRAGQLIALIISDVIGDPLETIASGPTVDVPPDPQLAISTLEAVSARSELEVAPQVIAALQAQITDEKTDSPHLPPHANHVIGNNQTAVAAAAKKAAQLGYSVELEEYDQAGDASQLGETFATLLAQSDNKAERACYISGGEPTVQLVKTDRERKGGRNQELVLAAAKVLKAKPQDGIVIVSGGTDGEDGPTDAAGAMIDSELLSKATDLNLDIDEYLSINNSYPFFDQISGLIKTGPTHTNVMDLRVGLVVKQA